MYVDKAGLTNVIKLETREKAIVIPRIRALSLGSAVMSYVERKILSQLCVTIL